MKFSRLILIGATAAILTGAGTILRAQDVANGTYMFEATDGNNAMNGSTVTFNNDQLVSWDMMDSVAQTLYSPSAHSWYTTTLPLTPVNSITGLTYDTENSVDTYQFDGVLDPNEWAFHILSDTLSTHGYDYFEAGNDVSINPSYPTSLGSLYDGFGDPNGNWTLTSVPDASGTFQLFVDALTALGTGKTFLRGRFASRH